MFIQPQARQTSAQNAGEGRLARLDRLPPQVRAIEFEQVEGIEEHVVAFALTTKPFEHREPILVAGHGLAVAFGPPFVEDLRLAATSVGVGFEPILIGGPSEFRSAFAEMGKAKVQAVVVQAFFDPYRGTLIDLASKYRLPYMSGNKEVTAAGGLVSMAANWSQLYERAAFYVDKILKGAKPGDLPVEQPTKFDVTLNMKTAQALGLTISPTLLAQIDEVIE